MGHTGMRRHSDPAVTSRGAASRSSYAGCATVCFRDAPGRPSTPVR